MKYLAIVLACLIGPAYAQEKPPEEKPPEGEKPPEEGAPAEGEAEEEEPPSKAPAALVVVDPKKILGDLTLANAAKDPTGVGVAVLQVLSWAKGGAKEVELIEPMAAELVIALKISKGNWGTLNAIVETLGELRSKEGAKTLKRLAFKKEAKDESEEKFQAMAIVALSKYADTKEIEAFGEMGQNKSVAIAKAAYKAFEAYGTAKGKVRKQCAEILMKRLDAEFPSSGGQGGGGVSKEKQERWAEVSPVIVSSMKALCGPDTQTLNDVENWREWWKENKKNPKAAAWKDEEEEKPKESS
jgi:hypothetical protein